MNSPLRALLFSRPVLGIIGVIFFSSRSGTKPVARVPSRSAFGWRRSAGSAGRAEPGSRDRGSAAAAAIGQFIRSRAAKRGFDGGRRCTRWKTQPQSVRWNLPWRGQALWPLVLVRRNLLRPR